MTARRVVIFTCDTCGRTAELDMELGAAVNPPAGWSVSPDGGVVECERHKPEPAPVPAPRMVLHTQLFLVRMTGPGAIPVRSMGYDMHAPGGPEWTFRVPAEHVETEPR